MTPTLPIIDTATPPAASDLPAAPPHPLRRLVIRGAAWTVCGYVTANVLRLASNLVLTRLLFPQAFGVMAVVNVFLQGLVMFSDVGIGPSIIQNKRGDHADFLHTAWTIQVIRGLSLWLVACALAAPVALFYREPILARLLPVTALTALIAGFNSARLFTAQRHVRLRAVTLVDLAAVAAGILAMVLWACLRPSIWALVAGGLVSALVKLLLSHLVFHGVKDRFGWDPVARRELFTFGKWIFLSTLLTFLAMQADRLIFGKVIPLELLGVYSVALMLASMPAQAILSLGGQVIFPAYSRTVGGGAPLAPMFPRVRQPLLIAGAATAATFVAVGPALICLLYDPRWRDAGWMLQILAVGAWFQVLECTNGAALLALGQAHWVAAGNAAKVAAMCLFIPLGFAFAGFEGAVGGLVFAELWKYLVSAIAATRAGLRGWASDLAMTAAAACSVLLGSLGTAAVQAFWTLPHNPDRWVVKTHLAAQILAGGLAVALPWALAAHLLLKRDSPPTAPPKPCS